MQPSTENGKPSRRNRTAFRGQWQKVKLVRELGTSEHAHFHGTAENPKLEESQSVKMALDFIILWLDSMKLCSHSKYGTFLVAGLLKNIRGNAQAIETDHEELNVSFVFLSLLLKFERPRKFGSGAVQIRVQETQSSGVQESWRESQDKSALVYLLVPEELVQELFLADEKIWDTRFAQEMEGNTRAAIQPVSRSRWYRKNSRSSANASAELLKMRFYVIVTCCGYNPNPPFYKSPHHQVATMFSQLYEIEFKLILSSCCLSHPLPNNVSVAESDFMALWMCITPREPISTG